MQNLLKMSAADLGRGIARLDIDPVELTQAYLDAIQSHPQGDHIYARVTHKRALAEAKAARRRAQSGDLLSPLDGVPISWKDLFDTAYIATESGSALLSQRIPKRDAMVVQNATQMGLVCLGKTHMSELAFSGLGLNPITATPPNKNDSKAVPGGSSSGAAASVGFDLAAAAIGSDTGGSVRIPAVWNDLVGLKTTSGRLSLEGVVPLCLKFDTIGPLCRTVEDASLLLGVLEGQLSPTLQRANIKNSRFAMLQSVVLDGMRDPPMTAYERAVEKLCEAGAQVDLLDIPDLESALELSGVLYGAEANGLWRDVIESAPEKMFREILARFRGGAQYSGADYISAWRTLEAVRTTWDKLCTPYDAVLAPTAPNLPPDRDRCYRDHDYHVVENLLGLRNTRVANLMELCALTIPTGIPSCGLMLMGKPNMEEALLRQGAAVETLLT